jgi:Uri superfamily endonuclease
MEEVFPLYLNLPEEKGSYCIVFEIDFLSFKNKRGKDFSLVKGIYIYVGSAFGPGGLRRRISRHLRKSKKKHWHFDFVTTHNSFNLLEIWLFENLKVECKVACLIKKTAKPINGFGSTDCKCLSHLFKVDDVSLLRKKVRTFFNVKILQVTKGG